MALTKIDDRGLNTPIDLLDNEKIRFGTGNDLEAYHSSSDNNSYIQHTQNGSSFIVKSDYFIVAENQSTDVVIRAAAGVAELYHNNAKKLNTRSNGIDVTGDIYPSGHIALQDSMKVLWGAGDDLQIYHDGSNSYIDHDGTGDFKIRSEGAGENIYLQAGAGIYLNALSTESGVDIVQNGAVKLYYDNSKKLETAGGGINITGDVYHNTDNGSAYFGAGNDLRIYHDGTNSYIQDDGTGELRLRGTTVRITDHDGSENFGVFNDDGGVELYYDNAKKIDTYANGINIYGGINQTGFLDIDSDSSKLRLGDGQDLEIYHDGTNSYLNNGTGNLYIYTTTNNSITIGKSGEISIKAVPDGAVELYHNNLKRIETTTAGAKVRRDTQCDFVIEGDADGFGGGLELHNMSNTNNAHMRIRSIDAAGDDTSEIRFIHNVPTSNSGSMQFFTRFASGALTERMRIETNGDLVVKPNNKNWSTISHETHDGKDLRHHVRSFNNGANSVSVQNVARIRQHWWGWGNYQFLAHVTYYWGSQTTKMVLHGVGTSDDGYSLKTLDEEYTDGNDHRWAGVFQLTSTSTSSPGNSTVRYVDVQFSMPNYTYGTVEIIAQSDYNTGGTTDAMGVNSYTLF